MTDEEFKAKVGSVIKAFPHNGRNCDLAQPAHYIGKRYVCTYDREERQLNAIVEAFEEAVQYSASVFGTYGWQEAVIDSLRESRQRGL